MGRNTLVCPRQWVSCVRAPQWGGGCLTLHLHQPTSPLKHTLGRMRGGLSTFLLKAQSNFLIQMQSQSIGTSVCWQLKILKAKSKISPFLCSEITFGWKSFPVSFIWAAATSAPEFIAAGDLFGGTAWGLTGVRLFWIWGCGLVG